MKKVTISGRSAIWLEHAQLINDAYNGSCENPSTCYELRKELFQFHSLSKTQNTNKKQTNADENLQEDMLALKKKGIKQKVIRKRKYKSGSIATEPSVFETKIAEFLQHIKEMESFENGNAAEPTTVIPRYWEEHHEFPNFKGANSTDQVQSFSFGEHCYLIPALSKFYNRDVKQLNEILGEMQTYDLIVMDPPWRNKYIRRLKKLKLDLAYHMLDNMELQKMPIPQLIERHTLVAIWCTNAEQHQRALMEKFLPAWNLRLVRKIKWFKFNTSGELIGNINELGQKQPYEMLYIACHKEEEKSFSELESLEMIGSIPSIVHSHKPPLLQFLREYLPEKARCLELFARYLQPHFTSIGLEVLKLMDERLYIKEST